MDYILPLLILLGGVLAISSLIIAKKPEAKQILDKITPYQALIGVVLLIWGIINLLRALPDLGTFLKAFPLFTICALAMIICSILLGFLFGMPQIAKWAPGESGAETKAMQLSQRLAPYQVLLGIIGIATALLFILIRAGIMSPR